MFSLFQKFTQLPGLARRRVSFLWGINFLYQVGFILAWVVITSLFLEKFGINNLLLLFFLEAVLILIGSIIGRSFFLKYPENDFLLGALGSLAVLILAAFFLRGQSQWFFLLAITAKSLVYPQLRIGLARKVESFFTPNVGKKAIPVIESAETIGTIVSSFVIVLLLKVFTAADILYLWIVPIALIMVGLLAESRLIQKVKDFGEELEHGYQNITRNFFGTTDKKRLFQQVLMAFIAFQGMLFSVVEYEFMKEVNSEFIAHQEMNLIDWKELQANMFTDTVEKTTQTLQKSAEIVEQKVHTFTSADVAQTNIAHDLGVLSLLFGLVALVFKLGITSKIVEKLGPFKTIITYFSGFLGIILLFVFGKTNMNWVRGYEHGCKSLFMSPYHVSFYATNAQDREFLRHFLEGLVRPLGIIFGVGGIILFHSLGYAPNVLMVSLAIATVILAFKLHRGYERYTIQNFFATENIEEKVHILEIISGSKSAETTKVLARYLVTTPNIPRILRKKIVETLAKIGDPATIHEYLTLLNDRKEDEELKIKVLDSLLSFRGLKKYCQEKAFTEVRLLETLQNLFASTKNRHLRKVIVMNIFANISNEKTVAFGRSILTQSDPELMAVCLRSCKDFKDPEIVSEVRPYLSHEDSRVRSHAIMAIWKFESKADLRKNIAAMLSSKNEQDKISGVYAVGELKDKKYFKTIVQILDKSKGFLRAHCLISLLKLGYHEYIHELLDIITGSDETLAIQAFRMRKRLSPNMREKVEIAVQKHVSKQIQTILKSASVKEQADFQKLPPSTREFLQRLYGLVGRYENIYILQNL